MAAAVASSYAMNAGRSNSSPRSITSSSSNPSVTINSSGNIAGLAILSEPDLAGRTYLDYIKSWTDAEVSRWLADNKCGTHAHTFSVNDIRGDVLLDIDQQALKEMGVNSVGERIKICVAVKKLRQACLAARETQLLNARRPLQHSPSITSLRSNSIRRTENAGVPPSPTGSVGSPGGDAVVAQAQIARRGSAGKSAHRIPPPLHLNSSSKSESRLPQAYQPLTHANPAGEAPSVAHYGSRSSSNNNTSASLLTTGESHAFGMITSPASRSPVSLNHPLPPAPGGSRPVGVHTASALQPSIRYQQTSSTAPTISTTAASPTTLARLTGQGGLANDLRKNIGMQRPSTSGAVYQTHAFGYGGSDDAGGLSNNSTSSNVTRGSGRPGTAPVRSDLRALKPSHVNGLSPISESHSGNSSPISSEYGYSGQLSNHPSSIQPLTKQQLQNQGYSVGKGSFARPSTSAGTVSVTAVGVGGAGQAIPLEDVMRKTVKFVGDDGVSKMVNVDGARDAYEVMLRALRKFGKLGIKDLPVVDKNRSRDADGDPYAEMEGWQIYADAGTSGASMHNITESDLMAICHSADRPERARGLYLRRPHTIPSSPEEVRVHKARKLRNFFGEDINASVSPTSPNGMLDVSIVPSARSNEPASPTPSTPSTEELSGKNAGRLQPQRNTMHRASTTSFMSSLGWGGAAGTAASSQPQSRSQTAGFLNHQKLRSFFGQRPPSELITSHLVEYFPNAATEKKHMSRTVKNQMRKSMMRRESGYGAASIGKTSWDASRDSQSLAGLGVSRFSVSSAGSDHRGSIDTIPPLPSKDLALRYMDDNAASPLRPPFKSHLSTNSTAPSISVNSDEEEEPPVDVRSLASQATRRTSRTRPSSRLSVWSHAKSNRDSDTASILTVEEITEDLEKRRASRISIFADQASDLATIGDGSQDSTISDTIAATSNLADTSSGSVRSPDSDEEDVIDEEDEENVTTEDDASDEDIEEEQEEDGQDLDVPVTVTVKPKKPNLRWVKGALIGAGSFGEVYLGMHALNGSFMAVKQVELPTGHSHNEERKKSMLGALEREIELLKVMSHPNIVQYLDSHSDGKHLHIFLEYVPGGSVAHLLSTLGAFGEALIRTFVRQILQGLAYLHENDIIHRDIKGGNILVDNRGVIKISDFGISKKVEESLLAPSQSRLHRPSLQGSVFWMAPEVVKQTSHTAKADIWSLGCLIVEMFTGNHPWMELTQMQAIFKIGSAKDARPAIPSDFSADGQAFLDLTFKMDHNERPTAAELSQHAFATEDYEGPDDTTN